MQRGASELPSPDSCSTWSVPDNQEGVGVIELFRIIAGFVMGFLAGLVLAGILTEWRR